MAHFAQLDENNVVIQVLVVDNADILDENDVEQESLGVTFLQNIFGVETNWKQTSYNENFRKNYAGTGFTYDESRDAFIPQKPLESWVLDEETCDWVPPIPRPDDINPYFWDEDAYQADTNDPKTAGWVAF